MGQNKELNPEELTTEWNDSYLFNSTGDALEKLETLKKGSKEINQTFRQEFEKLSGSVLLDYLETEKEFSKSIDVLYIYAYTQLTKNVNEQFFNSLLAESQDLVTEHKKSSAFAAVKLTSLNKEEWDQLFSEDPGLEPYRAYLEANYMRFMEHRPVNEAQAVRLAEIENKRMKLETEALSRITNEVTMAGGITLENGEEFQVNSQSYNTLLSTDQSRENRKRCYDKRFYHLIDESSSMASLYSEKSRLDDLAARELKYADSYESSLYNFYLTKKQVDDMNAVFKERKDVFEEYNEFRRTKLGLEKLRPYDLMLQLTGQPAKSSKSYTYTDAVQEVQKSYSGMDPLFNEIFLKMVTGDFIDVYPDPENGKQPGGYCYGLCALKSPALIFMNYNGIISDQKTLTHELGHGINDYLMGNSVDYLYCSGQIYEMEVPSTFNEELFVDYIIENSDKETAVAVLAQHIGEYQNYFTRQPMITEFEYKAHQLCAEKGKASGAELNALWTALSKEYRSESIEYYAEDSAEWTYINHIFLTNNYYTFNYAISKAITLALFKQYKEKPETFNKNYIVYLSAGSTMPPEEKLKKYFGIEINRQLFEDAVDIVKLRIRELSMLEKQTEPK
ncbi:M3 family oligoendopeptidase [Methanosarcina mazei]|jgi:oligoendopeptidase F|uniref:Peptidase n=5 Tax=Methanosarcina mazei TaxID=2209 RepID=A0A0F8C964_METMZ|nr:M3 family oligoendopeptidase [Methanosarcina mazei]AAM32809.1 Oligoendopeptidase F [Methanosarcina mazei Go1]AGF98463.1 Oligoendopeptidase F [Methanosarcina mazei Tuc01]AKB61474.1 Oligoendopeptidase F [Methanosarcina mazei SarPi]AKB68140.1 Oligoendopeptidase F [Methanosarcina mazei LYC]KKG01262.1 peptidase [Methanosarcina mazei]